MRFDDKREERGGGSRTGGNLLGAEFGNSFIGEQKGFRFGPSSISNATLNALFLCCLQGLSRRPKRRWSRIDGWPIVKPQWWLSTYKRYDTRLPAATEYALETVPFSTTRSTIPTHYSAPSSLGSRRSHSNPRIPGGICSIHENEIPGRRAKGTFEKDLWYSFSTPDEPLRCRYVDRKSVV